jgi:two-component system sensor histidine kinase HydH
MAFFGGSQERLAEENQRLRQELIRSERMKAVALLASGLAHEIKNPLAAIKTFTEYLPDRHTDQEFVKRFEWIVSQELSKIQGIVENLLTFAKPQPLQARPVALAEVIQYTVGLLQSDCVKRGVQVEVRAEPEATVIGDSTQLRQALLNLCLNSVDAMPRGGRLTIDANRNCRSVELTVEDTGCGIPADQLPHIFEPFFSTKDSGTGLGLSVVHGIITQHRGTIRAESQPGQGTRMRVTLPMAP